MAMRELKASGWPRGWKQFRSKTKFVIRGPVKSNREWTFMLSYYPQFRTGCTLGQFTTYLRDQFAGQALDFARNMELVRRGSKMVIQATHTIES